MVNDEQATDSLAWLEVNIPLRVKAKADYDHLDEFSKTVLAEIKMTECKEMSAASSEVYARAHPKYRDHRKVVDAANRSRLQYDYKTRFHELRLELWRTVCANERGATR